jgi:uncharacterized membrane protein
MAAKSEPRSEHPTAAPTGPAGPETEPEAIEQAADALRPYLRDPRQASEAAISVAMVAERYIGPLPHPGHLKAYEDISPGSAQQIIAMARKEQEHRHTMQFLEILYSYLGWLTGSLGFIFCVAGAVYLALNDRDHVALALLGLPVLGVIGWFVRARVRLPSQDAEDARVNKDASP